MKRLIESLNVIISHLKDSIKSSNPNSNSFIDYLESPANLYRIDKNGLFSLLDEKISDSEKSLLNGLIYLSSKKDGEGNMLYTFDESQKNFLHSIISRVKAQSSLSIEDYKKYQYYKKVLDSLKTSHFTYFYDLEKILKEFNFSQEEQIEIFKEIIGKNRNYLEVSDDEIDVLIEYNNSVEVLKNSLSKYGINLDQVPEGIKNKLLKHVNIQDMEEVFNKLNSLVPGYVLYLFEKNKRIFAKVAIMSSIDKVEYIEKIANKYDLNVEQILDIPAFLCPVLNGDRLFENKTTSHSNIGEEQGGFEYLTGCVNLFEEKGLDVHDAFERCPTLFRCNPKTIRNNMELFEFYGIKIDDFNALSGIKHKSAVDALDRYIESTKYGYSYIKDRNSKTQANMDIIFYSLYYAEKNNMNFFKIKDGKLIISQKALKEYIKSEGLDSVDDIKERLETQKFFIDEEKQTYYDSLLIEPIKKEGEELLQNPNVKYLEENCKINRFVYMVGETRISRLKVLRILSTFANNGIQIDDDEIQYALSNNSILTTDDISNIRNYKQRNNRQLRRGDYFSGRLS